MSKNAETESRSTRADADAGGSGSGRKRKQDARVSVSEDTSQRQLTKLVDTDDYHYFSTTPDHSQTRPIAHSGVFWTYRSAASGKKRKAKARSVMVKPRDSQPIHMQCLAPRVVKLPCRTTLRLAKPSEQRTVATESENEAIEQCDATISDSGPYCAEHARIFYSLAVRPSRISPQIRGLYADASPYDILHTSRRVAPTYNAQYLSRTQRRNRETRKTPIFRKDDTIAHFGGIVRVFDHKQTSPDDGAESSYLIQYKTVDTATGKDVFVYVDSCIEPSGFARFANGVVSYNGRSIGAEHVNSVLTISERGAGDGGGYPIGKNCIADIPSLVATRDIFHGDEIITDYGKDYWTESVIKSQLPKDWADYLLFDSLADGAGNEPPCPPFFSAPLAEAPLCHGTTNECDL